jgi:hypothetical protein
VGRSTPPEVPIVTFVHWQPVGAPAGSRAPALSRDRYQDLLWHLLLRGHDALFSWSGAEEAVEDTVALHEVYAASHRFREFLAGGQPVSFDVPAEPGPVVSGLRLGNRLLVLRTDFDDRAAPVRLSVGDRSIAVPRAPGPRIIAIE